MIILRDVLTSALNTLRRVSTTRGALPALANVLIEVTPEGARLTTTNLETALRLEVPARVSGGWASASLPAATLSDLVKEAISDEIALEPEPEQRMKIVAGRLTATLRGDPGDRFPLFPAVANEDAALTLPAARWIEAITAVAYAAAVGDARPVLGGVHLRLANGTLVWSATDSLRLARLTWENMGAGGWGAIVPATSLRELATVLKRLPEDTEVSIHHTRAHTGFSWAGGELAATRIEGEYPNFDAVIPQDYAVTALVDRAALGAALRVAAPFTESGLVQISLLAGRDGAKGMVQVWSLSAERGDQETSVPATIVGSDMMLGDDMTFGINQKFLVDALESAGASGVRLGANSANTPIGVWPAADGAQLGIIMPMYFGKE